MHFVGNARLELELRTISELVLKSLDSNMKVDSNYARRKY